MNLKKLFILIAIASLSMGASQCSNGAPELKWNPKIWVGDSGSRSIVREASDGTVEQIRCSSKSFDTKICMENSEIKKARQAYFDVINQCEKWKDDRRALESFEMENDFASGE